MAVRLIALRGLPDDEIEEIRSLLAEHRLDSYETPDDNWGVSMPAIWLRDERELERARRVLGRYASERAERAQAAHRLAQQRGTAPTLLGRLRREPLRLLLYLAVAALVLYLSTVPFLSFGAN